ncbi:MAG: hypothetical protein ACQES9_03860 [Myxococcota bacterium]
MKQLCYLIFFLFIQFTGSSCEDTVVYDEPVCGNGKIEEGEECDDGNNSEEDLCDNNCKLILTEDCTNGLDDDNNGWIDCMDPACFGSEHCTNEICHNGYDDDDDGLIDCQDPDCVQAGNCTINEICDNGIDDNANGNIDCEDSSCFDHPACGNCDYNQDILFPAPDQSSILDATELIHNFNYFCLESSKKSWITRLQLDQPVSLEITLEKVSDATDFVLALSREEEPGTSCGLDDLYCYTYSSPDSTSLATLQLIPPGTYRFAFNPGSYNGKVFLNYGEPKLENCTDGFDNDDDGLVDCEDPDCIDLPVCKEEICDNNIDDDGDGLVDCEDPDCEVFCAPPEQCDNNIDDDLDGKIDCGDSDCIGDPACQTTSCIIYENIGSLNRGSYTTSNYDTTIADNSFSTSCGGTGPDWAIQFELASYSNLFIHHTQTGMHSLALATQTKEGETCQQGELQCFTSAGLNLPQSITLHDLPPATYFLLLDTESQDGSGIGEVELQVHDPNAEICNNDQDDDEDGMVDCDDSECQHLSICSGETNCHNSHDDDNDGWIDCQDPDCMFQPGCNTTSCIPEHFAGYLDKDYPLAFFADLEEGETDLLQPCGSSQATTAKTYSFYLNETGKIRIRVIPQNYADPVVSLATPAGAGSQCADAIHLCTSMPAPGLSSTIISSLSLPAGGPYYLLVSPYVAGDSGTAQIIVYLE